MLLFYIDIYFALRIILSQLEATKLQNEQNTRTALQSLEFQYSDAKEEINKLNNQLQTARDVCPTINNVWVTWN